MRTGDEGGVRRHFNYSNVMSTLAVFMVIAGGTALAATVKKDSVKSSSVKNEALKAADLKDGKAVGSAEVIDNSLGGADINEGQLTLPASPNSLPPSGPAGGGLAGTYPNPTLGANSVNTAQIADNAVNSAKVAANDLVAADLATDSVGSAELAANSVNAVEIGDAFHEHTNTGVVNDATALNGDWSATPAITATCAAGEELVGVASEWTTPGDEIALQELNPNFAAESVTGVGISDDGGAETLRVVAVCFG